MDAIPRPVVEYPCRIPIKIIGKDGELSLECLKDLILKHINSMDPSELNHSLNRRGNYISYTFWVILTDENVEFPLRQAIQKLPGYVMQL